MKEETTDTQACRLILAEDDGDFRAHLASALRERGYEVTEVGDGMQLVEQLRLDLPREPWTPDFDVVVADHYMPGLTGLEVLEALAIAGVAQRVVLVTAFPDEDTVKWARNAGAAAVLAKPFSLRQLCAALQQAHA